MKDTYLASQWALIRRNELVDIPDQLEIHPDFLRSLSHEEFESAFRTVGEMFYQIYSDMADSPQRFGLPLYKADEYDYFSNQAREAESAVESVLFYALPVCLRQFREKYICCRYGGNQKNKQSQKNKFIIRGLV